MNQQLSDLLDQYTGYNNRGSVLAANQTMVTIIETLAEMIPPPCQCNCNKPIQNTPIQSLEAMREETLPAPVMEPIAMTAPAPVAVPLKRKVGRPRKDSLITTEPHIG